MLLIAIARPIYRAQKMCSGEKSVDKNPIYYLCIKSWLEVLHSIPVDLAMDILKLASSKLGKECELADS
jgi:hypothetical protein